MTNDQTIYFAGLFGQRSTHVRNMLGRLGHIKTPAQAKETLRFSYLELSHCLGCSPSHVKQVVLYGRSLSGDGLEQWRDLIRQAVRLTLGADVSVKFTGRFAFVVLGSCPVCGRARVIHYKGQPLRCASHNKRRR